MTLVHERSGSVTRSASAHVHRSHRNQKVDFTKQAGVSKRKSSYKVIYEEIDEDKKEKKLRTLVSNLHRFSLSFRLVIFDSPIVV